MSTIHLHQTTTATPEQFVAGLTDFGPGRAELFPNNADDYLKVHSQGPNQADVTEGSGGVWERLHYDWSDPNRVVLMTTDSNTWGGHSGYTYTFPRLPNGATDVGRRGSLGQELQGSDAGINRVEGVVQRIAINAAAGISSIEQIASRRQPEAGSSLGPC